MVLKTRNQIRNLLCSYEDEFELISTICMSFMSAACEGPSESRMNNSDELFQQIEERGKWLIDIFNETDNGRCLIYSENHSFS